VKARVEVVDFPSIARSNLRFASLFTLTRSPM
jgi:hypothetical protein